MKHEFHAQVPLALHDSLTQGFAIAWLVKRGARLPARWPEITQLKDDWARLQILSQAIITGRKEEARIGTRKMSGGLRYWIEKHAEIFLHNHLKFMENIRLNPTLSDLSIFPPGSWAIQITFTLRRPYISKDDTDFYIVDNPVKKEWVFKVPYVAPSQWKGTLRAAMVRQLVMKLSEREIDEEKFFEERIRLYRLFGNEKDGTAEFLNQALARFRVGQLSHDAENEAKKQGEQRVKQEIKNVAGQFESKLREKGYRVGDLEGLQGNLHFYPTFFDKIGLEVINPHDRKTGTGKQPIYFECVPQGAKGTFTLLYVPSYLSDKPEKAQNQAKRDLKTVLRGLYTMFKRYGFGAKTSSGYGVVKDTTCKMLKNWDDHTETQRVQG